VFDTDATLNDDAPGNGLTKSDLIRAFRNTNELLENDVYWHIQTGRVFQYQDSSSTDPNYDGNFVELSNRASGGNGFLSPDALTVGSGDDRVEFSSTGIKIFSGGVLRVVIGDLS
jgi:hypothetical protein